MIQKLSRIENSGHSLSLITERVPPWWKLIIWVKRRNSLPRKSVQWCCWKWNKSLKQSIFPKEMRTDEIDSGRKSRKQSLPSPHISLTVNVMRRKMLVQLQDYMSFESSTNLPQRQSHTVSIPSPPRKRTFSSSILEEEPSMFLSLPLPMVFLQSKQ